jgi:DNA polymerase-1
MPPLSFFDHIHVVDFEFIAKPSENPIPVCVVSHEIISGETKRLWLFEESNHQPPYSIGENDLFVAHMSSGEWGCHLVSNWLLPFNVIDTFVECRCFFNHSYERSGANQLDACKAFGIETISKVEKDAARDRILARAPYSEEDKEYIMSYCESDVLETAELFKRLIMVLDFDIPTSLYRGGVYEICGRNRILRYVN